MQGIVYNVTKGKEWTSKHLGLGISLHQATRPKALVKLFHKQGHIICYNILQIDNRLAESPVSPYFSRQGPNLENLNPRN